MSTEETAFRRYSDESGEEYFCPVTAVADNRVVSEWELDECVEASTVGRYGGSFNLVER